MKTDRKHTAIFLHCLVILSGILLHSILPDDNQVSENDLSHLVTSSSDYNPVSEPSEKDFQHSNEIFELVLKEADEQENPSAGMDGFAVLKQGITATEVGFIQLTLDRTYYFKRARHLSIDYSLDLLNKATNYFSFPFQPFANSIAINAP